MLENTKPFKEAHTILGKSKQREGGKEGREGGREDRQNKTKQKYLPHIELHNLHV